MTLRARILGVSVWGPGLESWAASRPILAGVSPYESRPSPPPPPALLPATERRRTGPVVRLALAVAHEAAQACGIAPGALRSVFASSNGDGPVVGGILDALATAGEERVVSPTQFHNSVHNAAAGYWSIATSSQQPATCLGAHEDTWAAGLIAALAEVGATGAAVLLCCYDHPLPPPLEAVRPTGPAFAVALVLGPGESGPELALGPAGPGLAPPPLEPVLDAIARGNPAARSLPLLAALARGGPARLDLPYLDHRYTLELRP